MTRVPRAALALAAALFLACGGGGTAPVGGRANGADLEEVRPKGRGAAKAPAKGDTLPTLSLEGLFGPAGPEGGEGAATARPARNLFAFEQDPGLEIERQRQAEEAQAREREAQRLRDRWQGPPLPPPPPPPPQPPAIPFTFIGYLGPPTARVGVFALSGGKDLILARTGDRIQKQFIVRDVGFESAEIGFEGFAETRRLVLTPGS